MEPERKRAGSGHIYRRIYVVTLFVLWPVATRLMLGTVADGDFPFAFPLLFLVAVPAVIWLSSVFGFRFRYSALGDLERTPQPEEPPLRQWPTMKMGPCSMSWFMISPPHQRR